MKRSGKLKNRKRVEYIKNRQSVWNGNGVNAGDSKLMLLGINLILLVKVNVVTHKLTTAGESITYYCWAKVNAVEAKTVNGEVQLQALVDGKKIIITESTMRRDLQLEDAEGVDLIKDDADMFDVNTLTGDEVLAEQEVATKDVNLTVDEVTLAQALAALKSVKSKVKGDVVEEPSTSTTTTISLQPSQEKVQDKGKGIMVEPEKPLKKKDQPVLMNKKLSDYKLPLSIVDWKINTKGKKSYYQIIRADGKSHVYLVFSHMLKSFDREDLETLWKLVKAKHGSTRPEEGYERVL
ncbi:hypothetical protein Tco_0892614 [Tanacetum coccineum]|uniref:Uncharacterized protein n=1 Tax=Tanacetum coccineum TaxID=301880 RepID=A0ABQ5C9D4_9ASTR